MPATKTNVPNTRKYTFFVIFACPAHRSDFPLFIQVSAEHPPHGGLYDEDEKNNKIL